MNFFEFYSTHPVGYSIVLIILVGIVFDGLVEIFKALKRKR